MISWIPFLSSGGVRSSGKRIVIVGWVEVGREREEKERDGIEGRTERGLEVDETREDSMSLSILSTRVIKLGSQVLVEELRLETRGEGYTLFLVESIQSPAVLHKDGLWSGEVEAKYLT